MARVASGNHRYTVLKLEILGGKRVVRMRNPWGKGIWKTDEQPLAEINEKLQNGRKEDGGMFVMPFSEVTKYFVEMAICHYHDKYVYSQKKHIYSSNDIEPFCIEVKIPGEYYVTVSKPDKRFEWACGEDSFISVVLVSIREEKKYTYVQGIGGINRDPYFAAQLEGGKYIAYVLANDPGEPELQRPVFQGIHAFLAQPLWPSRVPHRADLEELSTLLSGNLQVSLQSSM